MIQLIQLIQLVGLIVCLFILWGIFKVLAFGFLHTLVISLAYGWKSLHPSNWWWLITSPWVHAWQRLTDVNYMYADQITSGNWIFETPFKIRRKK